MNVIEDKKQFHQTDIALKKNDLLSIFDYIKCTDFEINEFMLNTFWQTKNNSVSIRAAVLKWLGYENKKDSLIKLLTEYNINFKQIKYKDPEFKNFPDLFEEANKLSDSALNKQKWIIMDGKDFKRFCLRTRKSDVIRNYYLAIEDLFKMYCEYTYYFQLKCTKKYTIDEIAYDMVQLEQKLKDHHKRQLYDVQKFKTA